MVDQKYPLKFEPELEEQLNDIDEYISSQLVQAKVKMEPEDVKTVKPSARSDIPRSCLPNLFRQPSWVNETPALHLKDFQRPVDSIQKMFQRLTPPSCSMGKQQLSRFLNPAQPETMEQKPGTIRRDCCMQRSASSASLHQQLSKLQMACDQREVPLMSCRYQTLTSPRPAVVEKVILRPGTPLDKRTVTSHYNRDSRIRCAVEQQDFPGLLKVMGKEFTWTGGRRRANGHKSAEEDFWWACGFCFFERRKKSTIKAHVMQRVCRKSSWRNQQRIRNAPPPIKRSASYDATSTNGADDPYFLWKNSLSV